ncbi:hypothetical protein ONZ45_g4854 [Pleurotus djamor]|nr:hypothetical protein ONZ45_g4854 [Pleurotus djamor]
MNTLMVDVLGYKIYGAHGGDFGAINLRQTQLNHPDTCRLIHFIGFPAPRPADFKDEDFATLDDADKRAFARQMIFHDKHFGYFQMQSTEVATIGYALYDSPALISWLVPKYRGILETSNCPKDRREQVWLDQLVNILLYQYTHSAHTSMLMYRQSGLKYALDSFGKDPTGKGCPMGVSSYEGEIIISPRPWVAEGGNLIWWKHHPEGGGHIPALIYPELLISDIRELFSAHWTRCAFPSKL